MTLSLQERRALAAAAVDHGRWMLRADNDGVSPNKKARGFRWPEPGKWIKAPDFNARKKCGGGLHGQDRTWGGYCEGRRLVFCEWRGGYVGGIDGNKIKVEEARILLVGELPAGLMCDGSLGLSGCDLKGITLPQSVGGSLDLNGCDLEGITLPRSVGGSVDLRGCDLGGIELPQSVGGSLYLSGYGPKGLAVRPRRLRTKAIHYLWSLYEGTQKPCHNRVRFCTLGAERQ